jgi:hypothetical protein
MKQNIAIEQLKELNKNQLKKLYKFNNRCPFLTKIAYEGEYNFKPTQQDYIEACYRINIGKMIEILVDNVPKNNYIDDSIDIECDRVINTVLVEYRKGDYSFGTFEDKELCDALWKAVKSILD